MGMGERYRDLSLESRHKHPTVEVITKEKFAISIKSKAIPVTGRVGV
jgi:hypothetical protein